MAERKALDIQRPPAQKPVTIYQRSVESIQSEINELKQQPQDAATAARIQQLEVARDAQLAGTFTIAEEQELQQLVAKMSETPSTMSPQEQAAAVARANELLAKRGTGLPAQIGGGAPPPPSSGGGYNPPGWPGPKPQTGTVPGARRQANGAPAGYPSVGTPQWNQYTINDLLRSAQMNGWQMVGSTPYEIVDSKPNPDYDPNQTDPSKMVPSTIVEPTGVYIINVRGPNGELKQLKMAKVWETTEGQYTYTNPNDPKQGYGWQLAGPNAVTDLEKSDPQKVGHSNQMTIGDSLYGTNNATGVFEMVPGSQGKIPKDVLKWGSLQQIEEPDGNLYWWGIDPSDGQSKRVNGMPVIPKAATGWGNPSQIDDGKGNLVWYGTDPTTKLPGPIPGMPVIKKPPTGPGSITQKGTTYVQQPDGSYAPAPGVPDPNPPRGTPQVYQGQDGFLYRQISNGDGTFTPDQTFEPVPYTEAAKQGRLTTGGQHKPGEPGTVMLNGLEYPVIYRGGGDDQYDFVPSAQGGKATPYPGTQQPIAVTTGTPAEQEFLVYRDPNDPTKQIQVKNPNYAPKDPAARVRQLNQQASDKLAELQGRIGPTYTAEQAQADFDRWWEQNVTPAQQQLKQDQQEQQLKLSAEQRAQVEQQRANYATAQTAGTNAVNNYTSMAPYRVGAGFQGAFNKLLNTQGTQMPSDIDYGSAVTYQIPDLHQMASQATAQALAHISPLANQMAGGQGMPSLLQQMQGQDMSSLLNRGSFRMGAGGGGGGGATTTVSPDGTVHVTQNGGEVDQQAINRRLASYQTEAATNQAGSFGGINPGGMAALMAAQAAQAAPVAPAAGVPAAAPAPARRTPITAAVSPTDWGAQARQAMNIGGWTNETPWNQQAQQAMNIGGWLPPYRYGGGGGGNAGFTA